MSINEETIQIKQGSFYLGDEDEIMTVLQQDSTPFIFELGNNSIPIDLRYGSKNIILSVDGLCTIKEIKRRFEQVD